MSRNAIQNGRRRYYARYFSHYTRKYYALLGLGAFFLLGVLAGSVLLGSADGETLTLLMRLVTGFVEKRRGQALIENFAGAATSSFLFVGALFLCGFSAVGHPAELLAPLFRGLGFGFSVSSLYNSYGTSATGFVALFLMPNMLISTIAILFCCRESLRLSTFFFSAMRPVKQDREAYSLRLYVARYFVAAVVCALSAFLEAFIYSLFANYFILG